METVILYAISWLALCVAVVAYLVARKKGPTRWASRVADVELSVADLAERHEALQLQVAKWRGRQAARDRRSQEAAGDDGDGEPDPVKDPQRWKAWVNSGGITSIRSKAR